MANEDFRTFTELDPNFRLVQTLTRSSWTNLTNAETAYVHKDYTENHFNEDLNQQFEIYMTSVTLQGVSLVWMLANAVDRKAALIVDDEDFVFIDWTYSDDFRLRLYENGNQVDYETSLKSMVTGELYFLTLIRADTGGSNSTGLYTLYIRTDSHSGTLVDIISVECSEGEQKDFRYLYAPGATSSGSGNTTGYIQNLNLNEAVAAFAVLQEYFQENFQAIGNN